MTPPFKGEAQGTFRRVPHPPPLKPLSATPPSGSLCGGRVRKLANRKLFYVEIITLFKITLLPTDF